jgi:hypothetical protein
MGDAYRNSMFRSSPKRAPATVKVTPPVRPFNLYGDPSLSIFSNNLRVSRTSD